MSDLTAMDVKRLRNEVQDLRDELALMKRKFEDIIYNLDTDNFSPRVVKQGNDMYTKIEQNAEEIILQAQRTDDNADNLASLKITADEIESAVFEKILDDDGNVTEKKSKIEQTAESIRASITELGSGVEEFKNTTNTSITDLGNALSEKADEILGSVESTYETKSDAQNKYDGLDGKFESYVSLDVLPDQIRSTVSKSYIKKLVDDTYATMGDVSSEITTSLTGVTSKVSSLEGTVNTLNGTVSGLSGSVTEVKQTANNISSSVSAIENGKFKGKTLFTQTSNKFVFDGNVEIINGVLDSPEITGELISLKTEKLSDGVYYSNETMISDSGLNMFHSVGDTTQEKFSINLGDDANYVSLRLGQGSTTNHLQSLLIEKETDFIRIGTYQFANTFVGMEIEPSSGAIDIKGYTPVAVFG